MGEYRHSQGLIALTLYTVEDCEREVRNHKIALNAKVLEASHVVGKAATVERLTNQRKEQAEAALALAEEVTKTSTYDHDIAVVAKERAEYAEEVAMKIDGKFQSEISKIEKSYETKVDRAKGEAGNVSLDDNGIQEMQAGNAASQRKATELVERLKIFVKERCYATQQAIATNRETFAGTVKSLQTMRLYATQRNLLF